LKTSSLSCKKSDKEAWKNNLNGLSDREAADGVVCDEVVVNTTAEEQNASDAPRSRSNHLSYSCTLPQLFVFDLDHTLIRANSSFHFGMHLFRNKLLPTTRMIRLISLYSLHKMGLVGMRYLHQATFNHFFRGLSATLIDEHAKVFLDENFSKMIYQPAYQELLKAQNDGHHTAILSSSPDFIVEKIAAILKVGSWDSTKYVKDGLNCFRSISNIMEGEQKAQALQNILAKLQIKKEAVTAYTDSYLDLPLLQAVGNPVGVNPDRKLRTFCKKNGWLIL
jgi:HAD superfamily hydrolase (TIGR01490 family)